MAVKEDTTSEPGRTPRDDPRYLRVRAALRRAVLELAADRPPEEITVAELTAAAGVSRTVFYSHASSPVRLLAEALFAEVLPDRLELAMANSQEAFGPLWREGYLALLGYVEARRGVYATAVAARSGLLGALVDYYTELATTAVDAVVARMAEPVSPSWRTMAVHQHAHGAIAIIEAWLNAAPGTTPDDIVDAYLALAPPWQLARPGPDGRIVLHRPQTGAGGA
ncbi:MAG: TetR/AcrR family transcriptional regulator [Micrococcales bacterium]|nr:TetR/AcrR family transcriptional regulator [Micrococcales bacterium]